MNNPSPSRNLTDLSAGASLLESFQVAQGTLVYEDSKTGSDIVVCLPGLGDTRGQFRRLTPLLMARGFRVIVLDPRGQGDSDATFSTYSARHIGEDLVVLLDRLGTPVHLIGNSSGAASAAWAAAERPALVKSLIFLGPFLRDHPMGFWQKHGLSLALRGPWAPSTWVSYYKSLFATPPADQATYTRALAASLKRAGRLRALRTLIFASKADVTARLPDLRQKSLVVMGLKDPDFKSPTDEAEWIRTEIKSELMMMPDTGHYPHLEFPEHVANAIEKFCT